MGLHINLPLNKNEPTVMHIDLNSCFATVEQQANHLLRGKPIAVAAYTTSNGCILAPSVEAKRYRIKTGMTVRDGKLLYGDLIVLSPDPPKYREVHMKLRNIFREYSPDVVPKSIDEAVIDFAGTPALKRGLEDIGKEIKYKVKKEIGEWMTCSIGIATNRFLAKTAASLHKPDGLDTITHENLEEVYRNLELLDLCGINTKYQARLNQYSIITPTEFLQASIDVLKNQVFQSIVGYHWYVRLRGWEIDAIDFARKSYGQDYAIQGSTDNPTELARLLMKLTEKMGRRLRRSGSAARGIHVACINADGTHWHQGRTSDVTLYSLSELYKKVMYVFNKQPYRKKVSKLSVSCYDLVKTYKEQLGLFETDQDKTRRASDAMDAMDAINDKYGEMIITPALMLGMDGLIIDRVSFGGVKELEEVYS